jgi:hypothetical protein
MTLITSSNGLLWLFVDFLVLGFGLGLGMYLGNWFGGGITSFSARRAQAKSPTA